MAAASLHIRQLCTHGGLTAQEDMLAWSELWAAAQLPCIWLMVEKALCTASRCAASISLCPAAASSCIRQMCAGVGLPAQGEMLAWSELWVKIPGQALPQCLSHCVPAGAGRPPHSSHHAPTPAAPIDRSASMSESLRPSRGWYASTQLASCSNARSNSTYSVSAHEALKQSLRA